MAEDQPLVVVKNGGEAVVKGAALESQDVYKRQAVYCAAV